MKRTKTFSEISFEMNKKFHSNYYVEHNQNKISELLSESKIFSGETHIVSSGVFDGTLLLKDGRIAERYLEFGQPKLFIWNNSKDWNNENNKPLSIARNREW